MPDVLLDIFFNAANAFSDVVHNGGVIPSLPDILYHYTTGAGLKGIIESGEIRANCFGYMNDSAELLIGLSHMEGAISFYESNLDPADANYAMQTDLITLLRECVARRGRFDVFGCCFADSGDRLSQWRGYANLGVGYSIGFRFERPEPDFTTKTILAKVIYDEAAQRLATATMIQNILTEVPRLTTATDFANSRDRIKGLMQLVIDLTFPQLKHKGFQEEGESRLIVSGDDVLAIVSPDDFLERNGVLSPYIRLRPDGGRRLPIVEIIVGPCLNFEQAAHSAKQLLEKFGYTGFEIWDQIKPSTIPFLP